MRLRPLDHQGDDYDIIVFIGSFRAGTLTVYAVGYFLLSTWTYGLSVPSGLFIPTLLTGAAWGRLFGVLMTVMFPDEVRVHILLCSK